MNKLCISNILKFALISIILFGISDSNTKYIKKWYSQRYQSGTYLYLLKAIETNVKDAIKRSENNSHKILCGDRCKEVIKSNYDCKLSSYKNFFLILYRFYNIENDFKSIKDNRRKKIKDLCQFYINYRYYKNILDYTETYINSSIDKFDSTCKNRKLDFYSPSILYETMNYYMLFGKKNFEDVLLEKMNTCGFEQRRIIDNKTVVSLFSKIVDYRYKYSVETFDYYLTNESSYLSYVPKDQYFFIYQPRNKYSFLKDENKMYLVLVNSISLSTNIEEKTTILSNEFKTNNIVLKFNSEFTLNSEHNACPGMKGFKNNLLTRPYSIYEISSEFNDNGVLELYCLDDSSQNKVLKKIYKKDKLYFNYCKLNSSSKISDCLSNAEDLQNDEYKYNLYR